MKCEIKEVFPCKKYFLLWLALLYYVYLLFEYPVSCLKQSWFSVHIHNKPQKMLRTKHNHTNRTLLISFHNEITHCNSDMNSLRLKWLFHIPVALRAPNIWSDQINRGKNKNKKNQPLLPIRFLILFKQKQRLWNNFLGIIIYERGKQNQTMAFIIILPRNIY